MATGNDCVLMLGLADAGKTSILYRLLMNEFEPRIVKVHTKWETIHPSENAVPIDILDLPGDSCSRRLWPAYFHGVHGLIIVIDGSEKSQDKEFLEFSNILQITEFRKVPILLFVNKQDVEWCRGLTEILENFNMYSVMDRLWHIQGCSAVSGKGIQEGLVELSLMMQYFRAKTDPS